MGGVGVEVRFLTTLEVGVGFFSPTPTPDAQLDHFLHYTPKLGIPVEMVQSLFTLVESEISCCVTRFPLILTVKFHSVYDEESEPVVEVGNFGKVGVGNFGKSESRVGAGDFTSNSATLIRMSVDRNRAHQCLFKTIMRNRNGLSNTSETLDSPPQSQ